MKKILASLAFTALVSTSALAGQPWSDVNTDNVLRVDMSAKGEHYSGVQNGAGIWVVNTSAAMTNSNAGGLSDHELHLKNLRDAGYDPRNDIDSYGNVRQY